MQKFTTERLIPHPRAALKIMDKAVILEVFGQDLKKENVDGLLSMGPEFERFLLHINVW